MSQADQKRLILCDCLGSQPIDADGLAATTGLTCSRVHNALCTKEIELAAKEIAGGDVIIACGQERQRFEELAEEIEAPIPGFVDLRDRAGWTEDGQNPAPKMAALAAEALIETPLAKTVDVISEGLCLIIGAADVAIPAAEALCDILNVTVLTEKGEEPVLDPRFDHVSGHLARAKGSLGEFSLRIDGFSSVEPGGRGAASWTEPRDGARSECDVILDLSGAPALFPAPDKREGYVRADPNSIHARTAAIQEASQLVGTFEKPLYVRLEPLICAHSRAEKPACSNCLNLCPTGAITSAGDHVSIDPMICAGCGGCAAVCPSGAITYDAPPVENWFKRLEILAKTYRTAGGGAPRLLVHDDTHGAEMIRLAARFGRGLPADVIPLETSALAGFGHAEMLAALGVGFAGIDILVGPKTERAAIEKGCAITGAIGRTPRMIEPADPDALSDLLYCDPPEALAHDPILPLGTRRQVSRLSAKALNPDADVLSLPEAAPFGAIVVDTSACTLCLSCVSLCPSGALGDNQDKPQLLFQEDACLQCGLCAGICPEQAITLQPQFNLTDAALSQQVLHEEEPFACIECGALFGVKSTVERISEKLANHSMFGSDDKIRMIQMCDDCRVNAQFKAKDNPFQGGERPKPRTTEDYYSRRKDH